MIELNKEYTYSQICEVLHWDIVAGNSKKAQINEIEKCFEFYHPINTKTKKEKKSYIFTKQLKDPVKPTMDNSAGNNKKNISIMEDYIRNLFEKDSIPQQYNSMSNWYFNILYLINREFCNLAYLCTKSKENVAIEANNETLPMILTTDYISTCKKITKTIMDKALADMYKNGELNYSYGYIYLFEDIDGSTYFIASDKLNEQIKIAETSTCNQMKASHNLSSKLDGRQLLIQIYNNKELSLLFESEKVKNITMDNNINKILKVHPSWKFKNYFKALCVESMDIKRASDDYKTSKDKLSKVIRDKTRKELFYKTLNTKDGCKIKKYMKSLDSKYMALIEKQLFTTTLPPIEYSEEELFQEVWGNAAESNVEIDSKTANGDVWGTECKIINEDV